MIRTQVFIVGLVTLAAGYAHAQSREPLAGQFFEDMMYLRNATSARQSSWDRTGGNMDMRSIDPGQTLEIFKEDGAGCIRHIYFTTIGPPTHFLRDGVIRMYWDGETEPSVEVPFGDLFGLGHERPRFHRSLLVTVNEGGSGAAGSIGYNIYFPMPYANGARITVTNEGEPRLNMIWYHIDYEKLDNLGSEDIGRFHAQWRRENLTKPVGGEANTSLHGGVNPDGKENYVILEAEGHGNFVGYFLNVDNVAGGWYGEGDDMIFIDGEQWPPSFHGTGSEEIFGGGACPNTPYAGPYTGFHIVGNPNFQGKTSMYRFCVTDPIRFRKSIKVSIEHGHANNYGTDYSSTAFWYQAEPHAAFPKLLPAAERHPREGADPFDQAYLKTQKFAELYMQAVALNNQPDKRLSGETAARVHQAMGQMRVNLEDGKYAEVVKDADTCIGLLEKFLEGAKSE